MKLIKGILVLLMAVFIFTGILLSVPRLWGFQIYAVTSGSMEPKIRTGDVIYVKQVPFQCLEPGDVITFSMNQGRTVVTHRVEKIEAVFNGSFPVDGSGADRSIQSSYDLFQPEKTAIFLEMQQKGDICLAKKRKEESFWE